MQLHHVCVSIAILIQNDFRLAYLTFFVWQLMLVIGYAILSTVYLYHDSVIHERRFGNIIRMKMKYRAMSIDRRMSFFGSDPDAPETNPLHKGYCNW